MLFWVEATGIIWARVGCSSVQELLESFGPEMRVASSVITATSLTLWEGSGWQA